MSYEEAYDGYDHDGYDHTEDNTWNEEYPGTENDDISFYQFQGRRGRRMGLGYGPQYFGPRGPQGPPGRFGPFAPSGPAGPYGPPRSHWSSGPPFTWGRGFGPAGPPMNHRYPREHKSLAYLIRCGVPKQNLKGLPRSLLHLIHPEYCGVCAHELDTFSASRLHYMSKNHIKNQKKWLAQQVEADSHRSKEVPLKSRDLYCELCDVHITSKTHAESHYAGKPHRAIVEGRKQPKNPYLLQPGMEDRVEQLIRREKKSLKPCEEAILVNPEVKIIQPDLYCDICKTSVTCTEQMTMHLNGKRHLQKEKLHILKMMKGETTNNEGNSAEAGAASTAGNAAGGGAQGAEPSDNQNENDKYDWGQGSGTWDDVPQ